MFRRRLVGLPLCALFVASSASGQERSQPIHEITFERAMHLAAQQGPDLAIARARIGEVHERVGAASVWRFNPEIQGSAGPRFGATGAEIDWSVGARQWLEIGGQRGDRLSAARAGVDAAQAEADDAERLLLREVGLAFVQALHWQRRIELAGENLRIAEEIARVARRRHEVGDAGGLEESVAFLSVTRARVAEARARAALDRLKGRLKILLGLAAGAEIVPRGDLRQLGVPIGASPPAVDARPDLRALGARIRQAESEAALGRAAWVPNIAVGADYSREDGANIVQGSLTLALPLFDHGQGRTAVAQARRSRIEIEFRESRRRAAIEVDTAIATSRRLSTAARQFEERGLVTIKRSERVATASYEAGAIPLGELLSVRRELIQAKLDYADLLLGAATARVELTASTGAPR